MEALQGGGPQLTIFHSGSVIVFDHVPAHKIHQPQLAKTGAVDQGAKASYPPLFCPSQSQPSTPAADDTQITQFITKQALSIRKRPQAELPFARKASLARFLEKRKDRVVDSMKRNEDVGVSAGGDDVKAFGSPYKRTKL